MRKVSGPTGFVAVRRLTDVPCAISLQSPHMEWMLQVVDELDDVIGSLQLVWVGARRSIALGLLGVAGATALLGLEVLGAGAFALCCAGVLGSAFLAVSIPRRFLRPIAS